MRRMPQLGRGGFLPLPWRKSSRWRRRMGIGRQDCPVQKVRAMTRTPCAGHSISHGDRKDGERAPPLE
jgi:hypothetical protein